MMGDEAVWGNQTPASTLKTSEIGNLFRLSQVFDGPVHIKGDDPTNNQCLSGTPGTESKEDNMEFALRYIIASHAVLKRE